MNQKTYAIPEQLVQATVNTLNAMPAGQVRGLLNAFEAVCAEQDKAAAPQADVSARVRAYVRRAHGTPPLPEIPKA